MSSKKLLSEIVKLILVDFKKDQDSLKALRRINVAQINLARRMQFDDVKILGCLKPFFKKKREV